MPTKSSPKEQRSLKAATRPPESPEGAVALQIVPERPDFVRSDYPNHMTVLRSGFGGIAEEVTVAFWQLSALGIDQAKGTAKATYLGSYVLSKQFAETVLMALAQSLGYTVSKGSDDDGS